MRDYLRSRLAQGTATSAYPNEAPVFPDRFRGRAVLECAGCAAGECDGALASVPTSLVQRSGVDGRPMLDAGACLFAPEEAAGSAGCGVRFTRDYRLASRTREGLVSPNGEVELAEGLGDELRRLVGRSLRLRSVVAGSCGGCEAELVALGNVVFDLARFGVQFVASPRHADGILITGAVSANMREALLKTYEAVPDPRLVIAVGACAASGGPFAGSAEVSGIPPEIPVDLWIAGCPPHPMTMLDGLLRLLGRLEER